MAVVHQSPVPRRSHQGHVSKHTHTGPAPATAASSDTDGQEGEIKDERQSRRNDRAPPRSDGGRSPVTFPASSAARSRKFAGPVHRGIDLMHCPSGLGSARTRQFPGRGWFPACGAIMAGSEQNSTPGRPMLRAFRRAQRRASSHYGDCRPMSLTGRSCPHRRTRWRRSRIGATAHRVWISTR